MESRDLLRFHLEQSLEHALKRIDEMEPHAFVAPTPRGGGHTLWQLGHLTFIEESIVHVLARGEAHPHAELENLFDGPSVSHEPADFPPFAQVLAALRARRAATLTWLATLSEADLDAPAANVPKGFEATFGTVRACLHFIGDHTYMHRGQLADARRAAGLDRMWV